MAKITKIKIALGLLTTRPGRAIDAAILWYAAKSKPRKVSALPLVLDIEPNNTCNFKCSHCQVTYWDKKPAYLDRHTFTNIAKQIPNLMRVKLQGMGEPLLNKQLIPMLQAGEEMGIHMHFHTNGSIGDPERLQELSQLQNTHVTYSIDGATATTFASMRPGSRFDRIVENIRALTSRLTPQSKLLTTAWTVITDKNIHELPEIVKLVKSLGLKRITIQPHLTTWGKEEMLDRNDSIQVQTESSTFEEKLAEAKSIASDRGLELVVNESDRFSRSKPCTWPWKSAYIAANGDVVPCCVIADADVVKMGNVFEQDFAEIWNSSDYQDLRERIANHDLPDYCKHCYFDA
jgi:radical SAM protein with 4Fe4S-binding SPASM domain